MTEPAPHHEPEECSRCEIPLKRFHGHDPEWPTNVYICPKCKTVVRCACDGCEVLISMVYLM